MTAAGRFGPAGAGTELHPDDASVLLERQMEVLELVAAAAPLADILEAIIRALEGLMPGARCSILIVDPSDGRLRHGAAPNLPVRYLRAIDGLQPGPAAGSCGTAAHFGVAVAVPDVRLDTRWEEFQELATDSGLVACWSTPIAGPDGQTVGTFAVYHGQPHQPAERERRLIDRFTYIASVAIEHSRLLGEVIESEELFRRSFEDNPAGEVLCDLDRNIERVNRAFCRLSGYGAGDLAGVPVASVLPLDAETEQQIGAALRSGAHCVTRQATLIGSNGRRVPVEATVSVIRDRDGAPVRLALNVIDLTERLAAEAHWQARREAEMARQIAEDHATAKSALLTSVSHEIRTPLQAIKGFTELLGTLDLDVPRRDEARSRINAAADHLLHLVTDVLDISRVEANALPLRLGPVDLAGSIAEVVELTAALAAGRGVRVAARTGEHSLVRADADRLRQVLLNLVGNALRHGRPGGTVTVTTRAEDDGVRCEIADDGPGLPEEFLERIFTPFARAAPGQDAAVDGYGLGLMLAHGLVSAMGGRLHAGNAAGGGAVFTVWLPRPGGGDDAAV